MRMIYFKDVNDSNYSVIFNNIQMKNPTIYEFMMNILKNKSNFGIREDILNIVNNNIDKFDTEQQTASFICKLIVNLKVEPELLMWSVEFLKSGKYKLDDFEIALNSAIEKDIPFNVIKSMFNYGYDEMELLIKIDEYTDKEKDDFGASSDLGIDEHDDSSAIESEIAGESYSYTSAFDESELKQDGSTVKVIGNDSGYDDMFNNLITVMTSKASSDITSKIIEENMNSIVAKYQLATSELASYSKEVLHEIENKDEEIKKLNAMLTIQQKLLTNQQNKLNEMRSEIVRLNSRILSAEKAELRNKEIFQKAKELQSLTLAVNNSDNLISFVE